MGFYEPLNEVLASIGHGEIRRHRTDSWPSNHPFQERPYYAEFAPFVRRFGRGIRHYDEAFALDGWFGSADHVPGALRTYLGSLVDHAAAGAQTSVFKCTRSLGRMPWFTQTFPDATHVAVVRNPLDQWCSAWQQAMRHGNPYFLVMPWLMLHRNRHRDAVASTAEMLGIDPIDAGTGRLLRQLDRVAGRIAGVDPERSYRAFLVMWALSIIDAFRYADLVVDVDALQHGGAGRHQLEREITAHLGMHVDFRAFDIPRHAAHHPVAHVVDVERVHRDAHRVLTAVCRAGERRIAQQSAAILDRNVRPAVATVRAEVMPAERARPTRRSPERPSRPAAGRQSFG